MLSMTAYAYREATLDTMTASVQIKSVNSRFLDIYILLPPFLNQMENTIRNIVSKSIVRGKVDVCIRLKDTAQECTVTVNKNVLHSYMDAFALVAKELDKPNDLPLSFVLEREGVLDITSSDNMQKYEDFLLPLVKETLSDFCKESLREGECLKQNIIGKLEQLDSCVECFLEWQPKMQSIFAKDIRLKIKEFNSDIDEQRLLTETALLLTKYTINEEIVRLQSHINAMYKDINDTKDNQVALGKKLDFLCQEIGREVNTIASKNQILDIAKKVIIAKTAVEDIREQSKNIV